MQIWLWQHLMNPAIAGIFFAIGHFIFYTISKTKYFRQFESLFISKPLPASDKKKIVKEPYPAANRLI